MTRIRPTSVMPLIVVVLTIVSTSHRIAAQTNVLPKVIVLEKVEAIAPGFQAWAKGFGT